MLLVAHFLPLQQYVKTLHANVKFAVLVVDVRLFSLPEVLCIVMCNCSVLKGLFLLFAWKLSGPIALLTAQYRTVFCERCCESVILRVFLDHAGALVTHVIAKLVLRLVLCYWRCALLMVKCRSCA